MKHIIFVEGLKTEEDKVRIEECRPLSKDKCWKVISIVEKAK